MVTAGLNLTKFGISALQAKREFKSVAQRQIETNDRFCSVSNPVPVAPSLAWLNPSGGDSVTNMNTQIPHFHIIPVKITLTV